MGSWLSILGKALRARRAGEPPARIHPLTPGTRRRPPLRVEELERRELLNAPPGPVSADGANYTLPQAQDLGTLGVNGAAAVLGTIGNGPAGAADVNFYSFTLSQPEEVHLATLDRQLPNPLVAVLTLYNSDPVDPNDPVTDPDTADGNRLVAQAEGSTQGGEASLDRQLAAGTYYVAVSGAGNRYFQPYLAGSGYPGSTGAYSLQITTADAEVPKGGALAPWQEGDGPAVLSTSVADGATLSSPPLVLRVDLSGPLDPGTFQPGQPGATILLTSSAGTPVPLTAVMDDSAQELKLYPQAPLAPDTYTLFLAGDPQANSQVLADVDGNPLGSYPAQTLPDSTTLPAGNGADFTLTFTVNGVEGNTAPGAGSNDTAATAQDLGDLTRAGLLQVPGVIGDDPAYNPDSPNPNLTNPANEVDLYHFRVSGPGSYAFGTEVFAGRIGSALAPGVSLFKQGADGQLSLVASNGGTANGTTYTVGEGPGAQTTVPLYNDAALFAGLTQGDYYLAVSSAYNVPSPGNGPGVNGVFDPNLTQSGSLGTSTGSYVLNLEVQPSPRTPSVLSTSPAEGSVLTAPPTSLSIQFDSPMDLRQLVFEADQASLADQLPPTGTIPAVFVRGSDGVDYYPRFESYDPATNTASFLMLDAVPNGPAELHLSGKEGLTDYAGDAVAANDPSGDYVVHFTVAGPARGTPGQPTQWLATPPNGSLTDPQVLGTLFPHEVQGAGVTVTRLPSPGLPDGGDYYQVTVLQTRIYYLSLGDTTGLPLTTVPLVYLEGTPQASLPQGRPQDRAVKVNLLPGTYVIGVSWSGQDGSDIGYQLYVALQDACELATPLTVGPAPALALRLVSDPAPPTPAPPPAPTAPSSPLPAPPAPSSPPATTGGTPTSAPAATLSDAPVPLVLTVVPAVPVVPAVSVPAALAVPTPPAAGVPASTPATGGVGTELPSARPDLPPTTLLQPVTPQPAPSIPAAPSPSLAAPGPPLGVFVALSEGPRGAALFAANSPQPLAGPIRVADFTAVLAATVLGTVGSFQDSAEAGTSQFEAPGPGESVADSSRPAWQEPERLLWDFPAGLVSGAESLAHAAPTAVLDALFALWREPATSGEGGIAPSPAPAKAAGLASASGAREDTPVSPEVEAPVGASPALLAELGGLTLGFLLSVLRGRRPRRLEEHIALRLDRLGAPVGGGPGLGRQTFREG